MIRHPGMSSGHTIGIPVLLPARRPMLVGLLLLLPTWTGVATLPATESTGIFQGIVHDGETAIAGATVRLQTSDIFTTTDSLGRFDLKANSLDEPLVLTASAPGYYIGGGREHRPGDQGIEIVLERHGAGDHREYAWVSAFAEAGEEQNCENCHSDPGDPESRFPFDQWRLDAHAASAKNIRFLTMYLGTDVHGNQSPPTRYRKDRDYGRAPIRPPADQPYHGPGYKLDFPNTTGNCATCHTPVAAIDDPYGVDPSLVTGVATEGIGCDFCHKISDVILDPATGLPFDNRTGVLSYAFLRPAPGHQYFAGPFDDVAPGEDVHSPLQTQSRYCAPCHSARFWGIEIYNSYGEWLASPYARPGSFMTCQDCHMPAGASDHFARIEAGGRRRDPQTIFSHRMPGAADEELLRNAVEMTVDAELRDGRIEVRVAVANARAGHHVPTDSPLRQMILLVRARDGSDAPLPQRSGPILPDWCGVGDPEQGYLAGLPGTAYAKILEELWTGVSPTGAYWNQTRIVSDNRIPAFSADTTFYAFDVPGGGRATIDARLLYRRAFIRLRDWKSWDGTDLEMARRTVAFSVVGE